MSHQEDEPLRDIEAEDVPPACPECGYRMTWSVHFNEWFCEDCGCGDGVP